MARFLFCLGALLRERSGNILMITAAALVPLLILVGSAVDLSRATMAKTRLQSACDAASLAARRVMQNDTFSTSVSETGQQFFRFNFPQGSFSTAPFTPEISRPEAGVIRVEAATQLPTVIMNIFGFEAIPLSVTCDASLNFVNTDVVLVLDVTGSMADPIDGSTKIAALRSAVMALYDELAPTQQMLESQGLRLRYGLVPYSSTVNVGRLLYAANPDSLRTQTTYPSRVANYNTPGYIANAPTSAGSWEYYNGSSGAGADSPTTRTRSTSQCQTWVQSARVNGGGPAPVATTVTSYGGTSTSTAYDATQDWGWSGAPVTTGTNRSCRRWRTVATTTYDTAYGFTNWTYRQVAYDTSQYIRPDGSIVIANSAGGTVPSAGSSFNLQQLASEVSGLTTSQVSWNGCIEERDTTTAIDGGTSLTIPAEAQDLDVNLVPNSDATRWRPALPDVVYTRSAGSASQTITGNASTSGWILNYAANLGYYACPAEARRLQSWDRDALQNYVNGLQPIGGTYHDIGMIWGARFISTAGVFGDGCDEYNAMPCNRHIIFMTDGLQTAYCNVLTAYGVEQNDMRVTGSGTCPSQLARHEQRFRMICNAAKNLNVSVWVIGFDTALNANLTGCASNSNQASTSTDGAALIARFRQIGNQIGALRLVK